MKTPAPPPVDPAELGRLVGAVTNLNDTMLQVRTGMKTRDATRLLGAEARPVGPVLSVALPGNAAVIAGPSSGLLLGVNFREINGFNTNVRLIDGNDLNGGLLWSVNIPAFTSITNWFSTGVSFTNGLLVQVFLGQAGGAIEGAVYLNGGGLH